MKAVYSDAHRSHDPKFFLVRGVVRQTTEQPERAERLLAGLKSGRHRIVPARSFGGGPAARVHSPQYLAFLAEAWSEWQALGNDAGAEMIANMHPVRQQPGSYPVGIVGRLGWHTADTACPIGPGTYAAAVAAADVAATAAELVLEGDDSVYALCRPPGHHAFRDMAGGFCYLNNSAIAAAHLRQKHERVAVLDVDVHHGNGTQGIFYECADVLTISLHADPARYYPYFWGHAHECGAGPGLGANLNLPLPLGTGDDDYLAALATAVKTIKAFAPGALVVALGLDASEADPLAGLKITTDGFRRIGAVLGRIGLPTVLVQEGGYLSDILGSNLAAVLEGYEASR